MDKPKKEYKVNPTKRQQAFVKNLSVADSNAEALLNAGYSQSTAIASTRIVQSKGVQALIESGANQGITDEYIIGRIKSVMDQTKDYGSIIKAIRLWINVKYPTTKDGDLTLNQININNYSKDQQLEDAIYLVKSSLSKDEIKSRFEL